MTFGVCTLQFGSRAYFSASRANLAAYCERHGYELHVGDGAVPDDRARHWGKLTVIKSALASCEEVLYLDADCVVVDPGIRFEELIAGDLLLSADAPWNANTGVMLVTRAALDILDAWERAPLDWPRCAHTWPLDELAFNQLILPLFPGRICVPKTNRGEGGIYDFHSPRGQFVQHFPNGDEFAKLRNMQQALASANERFVSW